MFRSVRLFLRWTGLRNKNASLVEEASAAAASLEEQAARLTQAVDAFHLQDTGATMRSSFLLVSVAPAGYFSRGRVYSPTAAITAASIYGSPQSAFAPRLRAGYQLA
ncbi:methyl-accepting chemotaxis protein III [Salmonella enterica subsp. enterica serovar Heidelberg str. RI-11-014588]|nr:methyl-accepting chemotaxis protein III [Salmonella enterica subsp. enterica serovar Heidelberg str. RI-11-014588]